MARESLEPGSRFASVLATPTISGSYFESRDATNDAFRFATGSFPVNYPSMWLRLQRVGRPVHRVRQPRWVALDTTWDTALPALASTIYFGYAVASHNTNQASVAAFRELSDVTQVLTDGIPNDREPLSRCSRRTPLVISEIMYHPPDRMLGTNEAELEFVEIFNSRGEPEDMSGFRLAGDVDYVFPANTVIPGGGFLVVARAPADMQAVYGISGVLGPWAGAATNSLPNSSARCGCGIARARFCWRLITRMARRGRWRRMARGIRWCWRGHHMARTIRERGRRATRSWDRREGWIRFHRSRSRM